MERSSTRASQSFSVSVSFDNLFPTTKHFSPDPNIPFNSQLTPEIPFGTENNCYDSCQLETCLNDQNEWPILDCFRPEVETNKTSTTSTTSVDIDSVTFEEEEEEGTTESLDITADLHLTTMVDLDLEGNYFEDKVTTVASVNHQSSSSQWPPEIDDYNDQAPVIDFDPKQTESYSELDSGFKIQHKRHYESDRLEQFSLATETESENNNNNELTEPEVPSSTVESFQEIYREALASTTLDPFDLSNEQIDKELNVDELDLQEEWNRNTVATPTTTTTAATSGNPGDYTLTSVPTGTEKPPNSAAKEFSDWDENSAGNRFRHFNSRNKEFLASKSSIQFDGKQFLDQGESGIKENKPENKSKASASRASYLQYGFEVNHSSSASISIFTTLIILLVQFN